MRRRLAMRFWKEVAVLLALLLLCGAPAAAQVGIIILDESRHDFGTIREGEVARHVFTFRNDGDIPFRVTAVRASCGCTTPEWTAEPVAPGEEGRIAVEYDSDGMPGPFKKTVVVESTADPERVILYIEGTVEPRTLAAGDTLGSLVFHGFATSLPSVAPGDPLAHSITIKNVGEQPIRIREAQTDAEYVRVELPENAIYAGAVAKINVAFVTSEMRPGPFRHRIDLVTTDEDLPIKEIRLTGIIE